ncbi:MAG: tRNA epoxyqueuosine(34) reductase QueG [Bauldia sp.]
MAATGDPAALKARLVAEIRAEGFDVARVAPPDAALPAGERLRAFVAEGRGGSMTWLAETLERRADPRVLWPEVKSLVMVGLNYGPAGDPLADLALRDRGAVSVYARNRDYHDVIKGRLKVIGGRFAAATEGRVKVFVDTAPVMEKPLAEMAGIGWQGKHTNLVSREFGSWLFLGSIFTNVALPPDEAEEDRCGSCRACLDACPTAAFPAPYQLDARRCISYLTIEHEGPIPAEFRKAIGNRIYGCDDCLAACPWNKFAAAGRDVKLAARDDYEAPRLVELVELDEAAFRTRFSASPIKRIGRDRMVRNALLAIGNSGEPALAEAAERRLDDPSPAVRGMAIWALAQLRPDRFAAVRAERHAAETDADVRAEWLAS